MYEKGGVFAERQEILPPARFLMIPKPNKQASIKAGHNVYEDKPYVEILKQGGDICQFAVNDEFKRRYPEKWSAFEAGLEEPKNGLPLEKWPGCTRAQCENLKSVNLFTVEDLANSSDIGLESYGMGGRELQNKAKNYLEAAKDTGAMSLRLEELEKKMEALVGKNLELEGQLRNADVALQAAQTELEPKKRGRPKKDDSSNNNTECD